MDKQTPLHGHVHSEWLTNTYAGLPPMLNIGVDMWGMRPVSEAEIVEKFRGLL
jgi:calcineurin-like phosphoesterase family protein